MSLPMLSRFKPLQAIASPAIFPKKNNGLATGKQ
jgi:hypothetical protein